MPKKSHLSAVPPGQPPPDPEKSGGPGLELNLEGIFKLVGTATMTVSLVPVLALEALIQDMLAHEARVKLMNQPLPLEVQDVMQKNRRTIQAVLILRKAIDAINGVGGGALIVPGRPEIVQ